MDVPRTSLEVQNIKHSLEDLSKDELVEKCRSLLILAQKARQAKDALHEEVDVLKSSKDPAAIEIIESFSKQKLEYVSTIDSLKNDNAHSITYINTLKADLEEANKRNNVLDTETVALKRQLTRMTDENGQLLTHLDDLEKQNVHLNKIGLEQRQQLLCLEQSNLNSDMDRNIELQIMLTRTLEEIKNLKCENDNLNSRVKKLDDSMAIEKNTNVKYQKTLLNSQELVTILENKLLDFEVVLDNSKHNQHQVADLEWVIAQNKKEIDDKTKELDSVALTVDDLNTALHKNKALVEVLQSEIKSTNLRLSDNQIISSGITSDLENENGKLKDRNKLYHVKIVKFATEIRKLKQDKENILLAFKTYNASVKTWKQKLEKLSEFLSIEAIRNDGAVKEFQVLMEKYNTQNSTIQLLNMEVQGKSEENKLYEDINRLKELLHSHYSLQLEENSELKISRQPEANLAIKSSENIRRLSEENETLKITILTLEQDILNLSNSLQLAKDSSVNNVAEDCFNALKRENAELLNEMNIMNQALKERGEHISQHQTDYEDLLKKQQQNEIDMNKLIYTIAEKEQIVLSLQSQPNSSVERASVNSVLPIEKSSEEIAVQTEMVNTSIKDASVFDISRDYNECETMSTSTISRADDLGRFKDLDTSWEDRYSRLRSLALKQKAKIRDLTTQFKDTESNNSNITAKLNNNMQMVQALQTQCDTLQDKLDKKKAESAQYLMKLEGIAQDVSRDKIALANNDDVISALKCDVERMEKEKVKTETWKKQVSVKVQSLKKELEANNVIKRDFETKLSDLNAKVDQKDRQLRDEINRHTETKSSLQGYTNEVKKQSVLNLEMEQYERTGRELNQRLETRTEECNKLQEQVNSINRTSNAQRDQIQTLEAQLIKLDGELISARQELSDMQKKCSDMETLVSDKEISAVDLMVSYEEGKREIEDLNLQLSKVMAEQLKSIESARHEKDALQLQVLGLEQHLTEVEEMLRLRDMELSDIKSDYDGYKVRAQSVLRQNQGCDSGMEEKLNEEADSLRSCMNIMRNECDELRKSLNELKVSNDTLVMQKTQVDYKIVEMQRTMEVHNEKYNILSEKYDAAINDHSENIKVLKAQSDTLVSCYRGKLQELESRHSQDILQLQAHVDQSNLFYSTSITEHVPTLGASPVPTVAKATMVAPPPMVREAAEGSENSDIIGAIGGAVVGLGTMAGQHPLEQLLDGGVSGVDVPGLRRQLIDHESRVTHLTDLLADTEQDLAKHIQMNLMLKEEIRRQQRSVEREKHAENLEYMKNIVVKFITLNNGDERQRLVPVLNTILKLSPDETQRIHAIAKGDYKGWSNYLPTWSKQQ